MNRASRIAVLLLVAAAVAWWYLAVRAPEGARPTAGEGIIAFGDSLVEGVGATEGRDFVATLSERIGVPIVNAGRRGDTAAAALERLDRDVLARNPRVVIVLLGGNDFLRRVPRATTFDSLGRIVERLRARGAGVVLVGVRLGLLSDAYGEEFEALAERTGAAFVPDVLDGILGDAALMSDQIHPNDRGYAIMADRIEPAVRHMLR